MLPIRQPDPDFFSLFNSSSIYKLNKIGDKTPPCLTPFETSKVLEYMLPHLMHNV